jgi:hypothetical protein
MPSVISVVCPTVDGREAHYTRCLNAYSHTVGDVLEWLPCFNLRTCGIGWQMGADAATGDFLHFTADDLEPHPGWAEAAMRAARDDIIPMPTIYGPSGGIEPLGPATQGCTRIPFCTMEQWKKIGPMIPLHYYTDNWFSERARQAGYLLREVPEYAFTHHWAQPARGAGMSQSERMVHDHQRFLEYMARGYS